MCGTLATAADLIQSAASSERPPAPAQLPELFSFRKAAIALLAREHKANHKFSRSEQFTRLALIAFGNRIQDAVFDAVAANHEPFGALSK